MLPLEGIRVIDLSRLIPGALCSMLLADFGAEIIKIEEPKIGDYARDLKPYPMYEGLGVLYTAYNRNKKSVTLNLKTRKGREVFYGICKTSDILIESYRPGATEKLEINFDKIKSLNPKIIYCSITGYGQSGPYKNYPGHDLNYCSYSGVMSLTGNVGGEPSLSGFVIGDFSGSLMGTIGILIAIIGRLKNQKAQYIDISLLDSIISLLGFVFSIGFATEKFPKHDELLYNGGFACYNYYKTKDNRFIVISAVEDKFWRNLCIALNREDLIESQFDLSKQKQIKRELGKIFSKKNLKEWIKVLKDMEICVSPLLTLDEVLSDEHVISRNLLRNIKAKDGKKVFKQIDNPIKFLNIKEDTMRLAPPMKGEHTNELLLSLGYLESNIDKFREDGII